MNNLDTINHHDLYTKGTIPMADAIMHIDEIIRPSIWTDYAPLSQCIMTLRMAGGMCQRCIIGPDGWADYFVNVHDCIRHWYSTFGIEIVMIYCIKVIHYISNMEGLLPYFESGLFIMYNPSRYSHRFSSTLIVLFITR